MGSVSSRDRAHCSCPTAWPGKLRLQGAPTSPPRGFSHLWTKLGGSGRSQAPEQTKCTGLHGAQLRRRWHSAAAAAHQPAEAEVARQSSPAAAHIYVLFTLIGNEISTEAEGSDITDGKRITEQHRLSFSGVRPLVVLPKCGQQAVHTCEWMLPVRFTSQPGWQ